MNEKLELKDLTPYLASGLRCTYLHDTLDGRVVTNKIFILDSFVNHGNWKYWTHDDKFLKPFGLAGKGFRLNDFSPILHPLSDLILPCLESGKTPIVELAKMANVNLKIKGEFSVNNSLFEFGCNCSDHCFYYDREGGFCYLIATEKRNHTLNIHNQLQLFQQLYSWHFWLGDQSYFEKGIIIDINTIK